MAHPHFLSLTHTLTHTHTHTHSRAHTHTHTHTHTHRIVLMNSIIVSLWKVSSKFHLKSTGENTPCLLLMIAIRYDHTLSSHEGNCEGAFFLPRVITQPSNVSSFFSPSLLLLPLFPFLPPFLLPSSFSPSLPPSLPHPSYFPFRWV